MMSALAAWSILLAGADSFMNMGKRFRRGGSNWQTGQVVVLAFVGTGIILGVWLLSRYLQYRDGRGYHSPRALFHELCRAHKIDWPSRRILVRLAHAQHVSWPAQLFLEPHRFELDRIEQFADTPLTLEKLKALRITMFGQERFPTSSADARPPGAEGVAEIAGSSG